MSEVRTFDRICAACLVCQAFFLRSAREVDFLMQKSVVLQRSLCTFIGKYSSSLISGSAKRVSFCEQAARACCKIRRYGTSGRTQLPNANRQAGWDFAW